MKKKNERATGVKRVSRQASHSASRGKNEALADRLELIVDQILENATPSDQTANIHKPSAAQASLRRPAGSKMSEDEINSLMERMIFSENSFNGYTH